MNTDALRSLGLTENEIKIYLTLLKVGSSTAYDLSKRTGIYRVHVYDKLEQLMDKGLATYVLKGSKKHFQATHPDKIKDYLAEKKQELEEKSQNVSNLLPELIALTTLPREDTEVEVFKGKEGIKTILKDVIKSVEEGGKFLLTNVDETRYEEVLPVFMKQFFRDIKNKNITEYVLTANKPGVFLYDNPTTKYRFINEKNMSPIHTKIYADKIAIIIWGTPITCIRIQNKGVANTYRQHFEHLWAAAALVKNKLDEKFKTKLSSMYQVGSLTQARSIIQAANQAQDLVNSLEFKHKQDYDLMIIGAGPAGLAAAMTAKKSKLKYLVIEQGAVGQTVENYPKGHKLLRGFGNNKEENQTSLWFEDCFKDEMVSKWKTQSEDLNVREQEEVIHVESYQDHFKIKTNKGDYKVEKVILAMGIFAKPKRLNIEGEDLDKVYHQLKDNQEVKDKHILIVGGGNSAIEAAIKLSKNNDITLSYRRSKFIRLTEQNMKDFKKAVKKNNITLLLDSTLEKMTKKTAIIRQNHIKTEIKNDMTFILIGFNHPKEFLNRIGA
jgi:thioredoxin reductase/sugar-specific transcriptional regulator TrmB